MEVSDCTVIIPDVSHWLLLTFFDSKTQKLDFSKSQVNLKDLSILTE